MISKWSGRDRESYSLTCGEIGLDTSGIGRQALESVGEGTFPDTHYSRRIVVGLAIFVDSLVTLVFGRLLGGGLDNSLY